MDIGSEILKNGVTTGIVVIVMGGVIAALARHIVKLYDRLATVAEDRRKDSLEVQKEVIATMQTFSHSANLLIDKIDVVKKDPQ